MIALTYFYIFVIVLCWTLNPFIKKQVMKKMDPNEYLIMNHSVVTIILVFYLVYLLKKKKCDFNCIKQLTGGDLGLLLIGGITTILATLMLVYLVSTSEVSYVMGNVQPIVIALSIMLGYLFFKEKLGLTKVLGLSFIIVGLVLINKAKSQK
jgi:uncharacterized membrane protein